MNRRPRLSRATLALAGFAALVLTVAGCGEDTTPVITKLSATPQCGTIEDVAPGQPGNSTPDTLRYLEVRFFGRASSGNSVSDPTGANSPLEWRWDLDGDGTVDATNVVSPSFRFTQPGDYVATLEVEDDDGDKVTKSIEVQVREEATDLDTLDLVAQADSPFRFRQLGAVNNSLDEEGQELPLEDLPVEERFFFDSQQQLQGWTAVLDGELSFGCTVAELYSQFDWLWETSAGADVLDTNPLLIQRSASDFSEVTGRLTVTEVVTGVTRSDSTVAAPPTGVLVRNGLYFTIAPGATVDIDVLGLMLFGLDRISFGIEFDPTQLTAESWNTDVELVAAGFTATSTLTAPGRLDFEFTSATPLASTEATLRMTTITFRTADEELSSPALRALRVRDMSATRDGVTPPLGRMDGFIRADVADCNDNGLGDTMELTARTSFVDQTGEGQIDFCGDCDENSTKDGVDIVQAPLRDIDANQLLDDCDCNSNGRYDDAELAGGAEDADANFEPDDCDCDWNGKTDLDEIREHPSFVPQFDPQSGLVTSYTVDTDQLGGSSDAVLDFCQDCDDNQLFDTEEFTILVGDAQAVVLAKFKLDIDANKKIDACDCDGDSRFDRGQLERQDTGLGPVVDVDNDGEIDACDCDASGELDLLEIAAGILSFDDLQAPPRPGSALIVSGYRSNVDVNGDRELDRCADCDENTVQDGTDIAQEPRRDIDVNGLPDVCDCDGNDKYDPAITVDNDANGDGVLDNCDCDVNGLADFEQIAFHPSTVLLFSGTTVVGYTSDIDRVSVSGQEGQDGVMVEGVDLRLDLCQDCDANGLLDLVELDVIEPFGTNPGDPPAVVLAKLRLDIDQNTKLDACDCNRNGSYDSVEIAAEPALDVDQDQLIDACDCNDNGVNDMLEIAATAQFDTDARIYLGSDLDTNANFTLDDCEGTTAGTSAVGTERASRR